MKKIVLKEDVVVQRIRIEVCGASDMSSNLINVTIFKTKDIIK